MGEAGERGGSSGAPIAVGEKGQCHTHRTDGEAPAAPTRSRPPLSLRGGHRAIRKPIRFHPQRNRPTQGTRGRLDVTI